MLSPKEIMRKSRESFEKFKANTNEYERLRREEISLLLDKEG